jgi:hypothetical protein
MANTTNFNWETPDDTDLVKDGAAAMRTLGNSIDTSFVDLKGGTTGQVLSKASNTDLDYTWVTTDDANAIQNAIVDAKGDLIAASANDTPARLAVGANGETLVADSSTSTGLRYQAPVAANPVLNSAFQIGQRGTSFTVNNAQQYVLDRWYAYTFNNSTFSRQVTGDTTNLPFIQYCMRVQRTAGSTSTATLITHQPMETINSIPYAGKTVTMSFYARKGANFSDALSDLSAYLISGTGTDQNYSTGYTGAAFPINERAVLTTTWQRFSYTGTVAATATELTPYFEYVPTGTAGAADYFEITGVQIEVGSVATPFKTYAGTIQGELSAAQRYYYRSSPGTAYGLYAWARGYSTAGGTSLVNFPVQMRIVPTSVDYANLRISDTGTGGTAATTVAIVAGESATLAIQLDIASTTFRDEVMFVLQNNNNTTGYLGFSAEL